MVFVKTTLSIDGDVLNQAKALAKHRHSSLQIVINESLRAGLKILEKSNRASVYHTQPHRMGLKDGFSLDSVQGLIAQVEKECRR